jgi:hypothetical protein
MLNLINNIFGLAFRIYKWLLHRWTGHCEIQRICSKGGWHTSQMSLEFASCLVRSRQLKEIAVQVIALQCFDSRLVARTIISIKSLPGGSPKSEAVLANVRHCTDSLLFVGKCNELLESLKSTKFDPFRSDHYNLLESVWDCMKPGIRRRPKETGGLLASEDWGEVGFQGVDPASDFRGMGMLGLVQLEYFARNRSREAREVLLRSNHHRRYYPFAATGINISAFVSELLKKRHLHATLFKCLEKHLINHTDETGEGPASSPELLSLAIQALHDVYCEIYLSFDNLWVLRDPKDIMEFPQIFNEVKALMFMKYPAV